MSTSSCTEPLPKVLDAHKLRDIPVAESAREYLGCGSRSPIDENDHAQILIEHIVPARAMHDIVRMPRIVFRNYDLARR